jgi:hypothetical protein
MEKGYFIRAWRQGVVLELPTMLAFLVSLTLYGYKRETNIVLKSENVM